MSAPIWGIPPDLIVDPIEEIYACAPNVWHLPKELWDKIWADFRGQGERIAILDTGYTAHSDLPTPVAQRSFISGESVTDGNAHGNHCAGTAVGRNGIGVAPDAELIVGKVLSNRGSGSSTGIAQGIEWAIDQGASIISMSLGGGDAHEPTRRAIQRANDNGILVCASAGNSGQRLPNNTIGFPGRHLESYCSGSMDQQGRISSFSSAGREMDGVTPGSQIVSTSNTSPTGYKTMSGTSMSCPFAAGLFAVVRSGMAMAGAVRLGGIDDWREWLKQFFIDQGPIGHDPVWGYGIPDYNKIVAYLAQDDIKWV
jgi:subtilisin